LSLIGTTVGNYKVTRLLGEGGMGVVYQAEHPVIGRKVAIKLLHLSLAKDPEIVARFFNEARAIHTIRHENIVEIMDFGQTTEGQPYFIMEFLAGEAMNDRLTRGAISPEQVAEITDQMCRALAAAHEKGIIHRDLKPHNVLLFTTPAGRLQVKLLDFGVAKILNAGDLSQSVKTRTGSLMGTPLYMSPEQCKGAGDIDHRTDIYSLGVMLYEALAGRPPFVAQGVGELFALHMLQQPPPLTEFAPDTPPSMAAAVMRALAKNPADRFASMEDLRQAMLADAAPVPAAGHTRSYASSSRASAGSKSGARPGATLVAPGHAATTLSAAPGEVDGDFAPPKKNRVGLIIAAVVLAGAGAGSYVVLGQKGGKSSGKDGDPAATSQNGGTTEPPGASKPEPPAAALAKTVTIRFEAEPAGTHVFRVTDDKDLGAVPLQLKLPRGGNKPDYVLRHEGYEDRSLTADLTADQTLRATLDKVAPPPVPVPSSTPPEPVKAADKAEPGARKPTPTSSSPKRPHRPASPSSSHGDEDGLATPTF